jgi:hypothetical protein
MEKSSEILKILEEFSQLIVSENVSDSILGLYLEINTQIKELIQS